MDNIHDFVIILKEIPIDMLLNLKKKNNNKKIYIYIIFLKNKIFNKNKIILFLKLVVNQILATVEMR